MVNLCRCVFRLGVERAIGVYPDCRVDQQIELDIDVIAFRKDGGLVAELIRALLLLFRPPREVGGNPKAEACVIRNEAALGPTTPDVGLA